LSIPFSTETPDLSQSLPPSPMPSDEGADIDWQSLDKSKFYVWSFFFLMGVRTLVFPPILIKTRLQVQQGRSQYKGTFDAFVKIFRAEGLRGYYKGFLTTSVGIIPGQFLYITSYEFVRHHIKAFFPGDSPLFVMLRNFIGGGMASMASSLVSVPLDVVTQLLMIQDGTVHKKQYSGGLNVLGDILKKQGIRGLYRGYTASMLVYVPSSSVWWGTYASVRKEALRLISQYDIGWLQQREMLVYGFCGVLAGCTAAVVTNPMDVVKTRLQVLAHITSHSPQLGASQQESAPASRSSYKIWPTARQLVREEGWGALKRGITARMLSMTPVSFLMTMTYEQAKRLSVKQGVEDRQ